MALESLLSESQTSNLTQAQNELPAFTLIFFIIYSLICAMLLYPLSFSERQPRTIYHLAMLALRHYSIFIIHYSIAKRLLLALRLLFNIQYSLLLFLPLVKGTSSLREQPASQSIAKRINSPIIQT